LLIETEALQLERQGTGTPIAYINLDRIRAKRHYEFAQLLSRFGRFEVGYLIAITEAIKNGPKLLVPSLEQCLALEQIELRIPYEEYEQPYPSVLIEFPYPYYELLKDKIKAGGVAPKGAVCYYNRELQIVIISLLFNNPGYGDITTYMNSNPKIKMIEDEFQILNPTDVEEEMANILRPLYRMILNLNLVLVSEGHKELGYAFPKRAAKEKDPKRRLVLVGFEQNIKLFDKEIKTNPPGDGTHASPKPHWRRGYYRRQHHGPGNTLIKRKFIRPCFVCASDFSGDMSTTRANYVC